MAPIPLYCTHSCSVLFIMNDLLSHPFSPQFSDAVRRGKQLLPLPFSVIDLRCSRRCCCCHFCSDGRRINQS